MSCDPDLSSSSGGPSVPAERERPDAEDVRRAKLLVITLLNSRTLADFGDYLVHSGRYDSGDVGKAHGECVGILADPDGLRALHAAACDKDIDAGFATTVRGFYGALLAVLERGRRSEKKMAKALRKAASAVAKRLFLTDTARAERVAQAAKGLLELIQLAEAGDWLAEDLTPRPMPEPPSEESAPAGRNEPAESPAAADAAPVPTAAPPRPDNRSSLEKAADKLYGPAKSSSQAPAAVPAGSGEAEDPSIRLLEQSTLLRSLAGWTRREIIDDLLEHDVAGTETDARRLIESVFAKFVDPDRRAGLLAELGGEVGAEYAAKVTDAFRKQYELISARIDAGRGEEDLVLGVTAMLDVPTGFARALLEMTREIRAAERKREGRGGTEVPAGGES